MQHVKSEGFKHCLELKLDVAMQMTHLQRSHQHCLVVVHDVGHSDCEWPACDQMLHFHCPQALLPEGCKPQRRITMISVSIIAHKCCCTLAQSAKIGCGKIVCHQHTMGLLLAGPASASAAAFQTPKSVAFDTLTVGTAQVRRTFDDTNLRAAWKPAGLVVSSAHLRPSPKAVNVDVGVRKGKCAGQQQ